MFSLEAAGANGRLAGVLLAPARSLPSVPTTGVGMRSGITYLATAASYGQAQPAQVGLPLEPRLEQPLPAPTLAHLAGSIPDESLHLVAYRESIGVS